MKIALLFLNLLLAGWLIAAVGTRFGSSEPPETFSVKTGGARKSTGTSGSTAAQQREPATPDSMMATIIDNNIFNPDRTPNAMSGRGRSARVEMTLVGTFDIGETQGAIIMQRTAQNNRNNFMGMGGMGMMGGGPGGNQGGPQPPQGGTQGGMRARFGVGGGNQQSQNQQGQQAVTYKQYVRVGETLSNGYTLAEVSRQKAVLTRGSDRMELEIQEASKNQTQAASTANANRRGNAFQQMQQMQQMQMMQNFQMMRMMQRTMQNQNQNQQQQQPGSRGGNTGNTGGGGGGGAGRGGR